jgi:predicted MFS family arabinose efflux permease
MFGVGYLAYATFVGTRLAALGAPTGIVVLNWVVLGIGSILGSLAGASLLRGRRSRALTLAAALAAGLVGSLAASAAHDTAVLAAALFVGLGLAATPAIVTAYVRQRTSDGDYAMRFSHATAVLGIGQLVGPVIGGILADHFGPGAVPALAAAAYGVGSALALRDAFEDIRFGGRAQQCNQ